MPHIFDVPPRYRDYVDDLARIVAIYAMVHLMFSLDGSECFGSRQAVSLVVYAALGVSLYHLVLRPFVVPLPDAGGETNYPRELR